MNDYDIRITWDGGEAVIHTEAFLASGVTPIKKVKALADLIAKSNQPEEIEKLRRFAATKLEALAPEIEHMGAVICSTEQGLTVQAREAEKLEAKLRAGDIRRVQLREQLRDAKLRIRRHKSRLARYTREVKSLTKYRQYLQRVLECIGKEVLK